MPRSVRQAHPEGPPPGLAWPQALSSGSDGDEHGRDGDNRVHDGQHQPDYGEALAGLHRSCGVAPAEFVEVVVHADGRVGCHSVVESDEFVVGGGPELLDAVRHPGSVGAVPGLLARARLRPTTCQVLGANMSVDLRQRALTCVYTCCRAHWRLRRRPITTGVDGMSEVLEKLRDSVDQVVRHFAPRERPVLEVVGHDGLTGSERLDLLVQYRATVGAKTAATETHRLRSEAIKEKLQPRPRPRPRRSV